MSGRRKRAVRRVLAKSRFVTSAVLAIAPLWEAIAKDAQRSAAECFPDTARDPSAFEPIIGTRIRASIPLTNFDPSES